MFDPGRWARAFVGVTGNDAEEALAIFKIFSDRIKKIPGCVFGTWAAESLEKIIGKTVEQMDIAGTQVPEITSRFVVLLIKRNLFRYSDRIIAEIQKILDRKNRIVPVVLESAFAPDNLESELIAALKKRTGAEEIRLEKRTVPGLIGGYRLKIGDEVIDASILGQLRKMETALASGIRAAASANINNGGA